MRRPLIISLIVAGVVLFLVVSALLARALSVGDAEDSAITTLVTAEAQGDVHAVEADIAGCAASAACRARAGAVAAALRRPGGVSIIQIQRSSGFSLGPTTGIARVAWLVGGSLPRVQCVRVHHSGNALEGFKIQLLEVSVKIPGGSNCPKRF